jgi:uncharacterized membrane protein
VKLLKLIFLLPILLLTINFFVFPVKADSEQINSFNSTIVAHRDGTMSVSEIINYDFSGNSRHGIFRDIPTKSRVGDLERTIQITVTNLKKDGLAEEFSVSSDSSKITIKIGDPNKIINGTHLYEIDYTVANGIGSNFSDHDEIFWNATGNDWTVPINSAKLDLSDDFGVIPTKADCFTGPTGSTEKNCSTMQNENSFLITATSLLNSGSGLTGVVAFPVNTFPKSLLRQSTPNQVSNSANDWLSNHLHSISFVFFNLILAPILIIWYFVKKHHNRFGKVKVNFDIPELSGQKLRPAEVGTIDNAKLDKNDIVATIFDLAIRKYLKFIDKSTQKSFLGIKRQSVGHFIQKLAGKDITLLNDYETTLYLRLFQDGDLVDISSLRSDFYLTANIIETKLFSSLVNKNLYAKNPKTQKAILLMISIWSAISLNILLALVLFWLSRVLNGRTTTGDKIDWEVSGLKLFFKNMSREYKWQADNLITVEKYLPYAIALGYINEFMSQLKIIYPNYNPSWYSGGLFLASYNNYFNSLNSSFVTTAPGSSSGFSGGGFSGGGGGGGGGGSW